MNRLCALSCRNAVTPGAAAGRRRGTLCPGPEERGQAMAKATVHKMRKAPARTALVITRTFDAPREAVWKAWTETSLVKKWWGPKFFTAPVIKIDLRVGGKYLNCMRGPDGKEYWSTGVYREIAPPERLVMTDSFANEKGKVVSAAHYGMGRDFPRELLVTMTLEEAGGRTKMTLKHEGMPAGMMQEMAGTGWSESFDKLAGFVVPDGRTRIIAERGKQEVIVTRTFDVPREALFRTYTDRNLIPRWWGPERFATTVDKMEVKTGGLWRIVQRSGSDVYAFHGAYHEVRSPELVVSTFEFEGAPGHVSLDSVTFEEIGARTRLTERTVFQSAGDRDDMLKEGMEEGVYESMDRLAALAAHPDVERKAA